MTESSDQLTSVHGDSSHWPVTWDACPVLSARSRPSGDGPSMPANLPLALPLQLEATTHQLARITDDVGQDPANGPDLALLLTEQMSALERTSPPPGDDLRCGHPACW